MRNTIIMFLLCLGIFASQANAQSDPLSSFKKPTSTTKPFTNWLPVASPDAQGCKANHVTDRAYATANTKQRAIMDAAKNSLDAAAKGASAKAALNITIPVVVHVVHNGGAELIGEYQITDAITQMNEDFAGQPYVSDGFGYLQATTGYTFKLAKLDPNGNATSGITYTQSTITNNGSEGPLQSLINWPREKYLNVWVVKSSDGSNGSAYSNYPYSVANGTGREHWDGIVVSYWAIGRTGAAVSTHYKIMSHEAGHWANLKHTWGDQTEYGSDAACNDDDGVSDTPNTKGNGGCGPLVSCGTQDNEQNFMDYGSCSTMFTIGQANRMNAAMQSSVSGRNNIWSQANLVATGLATGSSSSGGSSSGGSGSSSSGGALTNGVAVNNLSAAQGTDLNYYIDVPNGASNLFIETSGGTGDSDMYVKLGSAPTNSSYDCRPYGGGNGETCGDAEDPLTTAQGRWYIRLNAYQTFSGMTLRATYQGGSGSSGGSSSGGSSSGGSSSGGSSSGGSSSGGGLSNGQTVTGLGAAQNQRTANYYIDVPAGASNLSIKIAAGSGSTGDADLFVKKGSVPTDSSYDCRPWDSGSNETCGTGGDTLATSAGRFHINLRAYSTFTNVTLTASYTSGGSSSGGSSSGGSSSGGSSSGGSSSGGSSSGGLSNGQTVTGLGAAQNQRTANYYIDVPAGASNLSIKIVPGSGATGDADLFVKKGSIPTDSSYDCRPWDNGNTETCGTGGDTLATSAGRFHINLRAYSTFTNVSLTATYTQ